MKKQFLVICILILAISSCERDDICIEDATPNFTIRLYDSEDPTEFKAISGLKIKLLETDVDTLLFNSDSITLPIRKEREGNIHPLSKVAREVEVIFTSMGFSMATGPEIEDDWHNFTALNTPEHHPARQMQDTFYMPDKTY